MVKAKYKSHTVKRRCSVRRRKASTDAFSWALGGDVPPDLRVSRFERRTRNDELWETACADVAAAISAKHVEVYVRMHHPIAINPRKLLAAVRKRLPAAKRIYDSMHPSLHGHACRCRHMILIGLGAEEAARNSNLSVQVIATNAALVLDRYLRGRN